MLLVALSSKEDQESPWLLRSLKTSTRLVFQQVARLSCQNQLPDWSQMQVSSGSLATTALHLLKPSSLSKFLLLLLDLRITGSSGSFCFCESFPNNTTMTERHSLTFDLMTVHLLLHLISAERFTESTEEPCFP